MVEARSRVRDHSGSAGQGARVRRSSVGADMGQLKGTGVQSESSAPPAETGSSSMANPGGTLAGRLHLVVCAAGIIASLMLYSVLQVLTWSASHTGRASCCLTLAKCLLRAWASQSFAPPCTFVVQQRCGAPAGAHHDTAVRRVWRVFHNLALPGAVQPLAHGCVGLRPAPGTLPCLGTQSCLHCVCAVKPGDRQSPAILPMNLKKCDHGVRRPLARASVQWRHPQHMRWCRFPTWLRPHASTRP